MQCTERTIFSFMSHVNWATWLLVRAAKQLHKMYMACL